MNQKEKGGSKMPSFLFEVSLPISRMFFRPSYAKICYDFAAMGLWEWGGLAG